MRFLTSALFLLLLAAPAAWAQKITKETLVSQNKKHTYYLFVPESVQSKKPVPLLILLHGSNRNGLSLVEKWKDLASREGIILAGPDAVNPQYWSQPADGPEAIRDLVEGLKAKYPINARRVYLFGHSAGAVFSLNLSMLESEYFAAMAIHAGSWRQREEFQLLGQVKRKIPLAIWVGTVDDFFPLSSVHATRDAMKAQGLTVQLKEMPGHNHWYYDLAPQINDEAWQFLKQYELEAEPRYEEYGKADAAKDANVLMAEAAALQNKTNDLVQKFNEQEILLRGKDFNTQRAEINQLTEEEAAILRENAALWRQAADKIEQASRLQVGDKYRKYLSVIAQHNRKRAEAIDSMIEMATAMLSASDSYDAILAKREAAQKRAAQLNAEADELQKQATQMMK